MRQEELHALQSRLHRHTYDAQDLERAATVIMSFVAIRCDLTDLERQNTKLKEENKQLRREAIEQYATAMTLRQKLRGEK